MRELTWLEAGIGAAEGEILALQAELGVDLPLDAAQFLMAHAGASNPDEDEFDVTDATGRRRVSCLGGVLQVGDTTWGIRQAANQIDGLPLGVVPIIETGFGDYVCLDFRQGSRGEVVYYFHERLPPDCIAPLAGSVTEFLELLRPGED